MIISIAVGCIPLILLFGVWITMNPPNYGYVIHQGEIWKIIDCHSIFSNSWDESLFTGCNSIRIQNGSKFASGIVSDSKIYSSIDECKKYLKK